MEYDHVVKIDQYSTYWMCKYVLEGMGKRGEGSIVNISSIGSQGVAGIAYSAAKAAVNAMTKNIACYYAATDTLFWTPLLTRDRAVLFCENVEKRFSGCSSACRPWLGHG